MYDDWQMRPHGPGAIYDGDENEHEGPEANMMAFPSVPARTASQSSEWHAAPTASHHR